VDDAPFPGGPGTHFDGKILTSGTAHGGVVPGRLWMRAKGDLGDDPIVHACALAYVSDYGSGFAGVEVPQLSQAGGSLDHVLWFHSPLRLDGWVLLDTWPLRASGARGTYMGAVHDQAGVLGAVFAQEALLRVRPPGDLPPMPGMTGAVS
jgi:acyl-CoA thioesterase-2